MFPVCFLYHLSQFPIHECLSILCIGLERKDPDVVWLRVRLLVKLEFAEFFLSFELMFINDNI
jgi:hypothetical protein